MNNIVSGGHRLYGCSNSKKGKEVLIVNNEQIALDKNVRYSLKYGSFSKDDYGKE